jgi:hypothetical protein
MKNCNSNPVSAVNLSSVFLFFSLANKLDPRSLNSKINFLIFINESSASNKSEIASFILSIISFELY